jgi:hypothetical protein
MGEFLDTCEIGFDAIDNDIERQTGCEQTGESFHVAESRWPERCRSFCEDVKTDENGDHCYREREEEKRSAEASFNL